MANAEHTLSSPSKLTAAERCAKARAAAAVAAQRRREEKAERERVTQARRRLVLEGLEPPPKSLGSKKASTKALQVHAKVSHGHRVFAAGGDGRSAWSWRWKRLFASHVASLGGAENLSAAQLSLIKRVASTEVQIEFLESLMSESACEMAELDLYNRLVGNLRRLLATLGLERASRDVTPTNPLSEHFARRKAKSPFREVIDAMAVND